MTLRQFVVTIVTPLGAAVALMLMVTALWAWGRAGWIAADATRPDVARWAVRSAAVAAGAIAQLLLLTFVAGRIFRHRRFMADAARVCASVVACVAIVSAVALGLAGR
ncbi:hypothetical protein BH09PLA1_BH09PLA1_14780 [soil metagenome]